jgi:hypothetical protein
LKEEVEAITNKKRMMLLIPFVYRSFDVVDRGIEPLKTKENIGKIYC